MKKRFVFINQAVKERACLFIKKLPMDEKAAYQAVISKADRRTLDQNAKLHAMLGDISRQVEHYGKKFSPLVWKRLCTAAYLREINANPILIPALDNSGIDIIYEQTSKMSKRMLSGLIEWVYAFGTENEVKWSERITCN